MLVSNSKGLVEDSRMIGSDIVRSAENIRQHYIIERELADRLRHASREERRAGLYAAVYNELFRRVPDHPQISRKSNPAAQAVHASRELQLVARLSRDWRGRLQPGVRRCREGDYGCDEASLAIQHAVTIGAAQAHPQHAVAGRPIHELVEILTESRESYTLRRPRHASPRKKIVAR
jgi:hypothetical protein